MTRSRPRGTTPADRSYARSFRTAITSASCLARGSSRCRSSPLVSETSADGSTVPTLSMSTAWEPASPADRERGLRDGVQYLPSLVMFLLGWSCFSWASATRCLRPRRSRPALHHPESHCTPVPAATGQAGQWCGRDLGAFITRGCRPTRTCCPAQSRSRRGAWVLRPKAVFRHLGSRHASLLWLESARYWPRTHCPVVVRRQCPRGLKKPTSMKPNSTALPSNSVCSRSSDMSSGSAPR
jgi:hypothetical protein